MTMQTTTLTLIPTGTPITPSPDQKEAVAALLSFIQDPAPTSPFFVFAGFAGTGKTFCMREVVASAAKSAVSFAFTAPTNKAAKVLRGITGEACTIFSLLGLRIEKTGEMKQLAAGKAPNDLSDIDVIFLDEAGMVNKHLYSILLERAAKYGLKVVFMGDKAQLPPIGEPHSPVWDLPANVSLTKVMRHDNQILSLVTTIRGQITHIAPSLRIKSDHAGDEGVWKMTKLEFRQAIYEAASSGGFSDGTVGKVIAWRNKTVEDYNNLIRQALYGTDSRPGYFVLGDRLVAAGPCKRGEDMLLSTDDEAIVEGIAESQHPFASHYKMFELKCRTEVNTLVRLWVIHPESQPQYDADCQSLADEAKVTPRLWKKFWELKELFHDVKYAYALTAHRAQGSTYTNVWVDSSDILQNRDRKEGFQCLYVACSRAQKKLFVL